MQAKLQNQCDRLIENYNRLRTGNKLEFDGLLVAGASLYLAKDTEVDRERLEMCKTLLKKRKGVFSSFRGVAEFLVRCKMALSDDPERYLERLDAVYQSMKSFFSDERTLLAAMVIADLAAPEGQAAAVEKTKSIYSDMRSAHPWLTSQEDMPFAALMAVTGKDPGSVYEEAEKAYGILKEALRTDGESRQMLSHILALYPGYAESKCEKLCRIDAGLRETKHALSRDRYVSILGTLVSTDASADTLVSMIGEADDYLKQFKPFHGLFGVGRDARRMAAVQMVQSVLETRQPAGIPDVSAIPSVISSSIEMTIIMLILMCAIIASTNAAQNT